MKSKTLVERQLEILNSENKNLTKKNTKLLSDISKKNIKIDDLTILVNNTIASVNKLTNEVSTLRQECALLNFKCNNYEKQIATLKSDLSQADATIAKLNDENIVLRKENSDLKAQIVILKNDNDRMKKIINNDSNNSSNPPSSDIKKNIPNNRSKSKNSIGGQKGHKPHFLSKKDIEDKIKDNKFNHNVVNVGKISDTYVSKYIVDISVSVNATEYRFFMDKNGKFNIPKEFKNDVQYGNELKTLCAVLNTEGIVAIDRLNGFVSSITHGKINMSNGTIVNFINSLAKKSSDVIADLKNNLLNSNLMYTDATTARCSNRTISVRNYSTSKYTLLKATLGKSKKCIEETGILNNYAGNLVHDHETLMYNYGNKHGECNSHVSRYLKGCLDMTKNIWSIDMKSFLNSLNYYKKKLIEKNIMQIDEIKLLKYSKRYDEILSKGLNQNENISSKYDKTQEKRLLNRLKKYKDNHLMFIFDFSIPFDNNLSERDLRHVKCKQKISGYFNSMIGIQNYLDIKSIIGTCKKQNTDFYNIIRNIYENTPVTL